MLVMRAFGKSEPVVPVDVKFAKNRTDHIPCTVTMKISALVSWPSAPLTDSLVRKALETNNFQVELTTDTNVGKEENFLQWSTYDNLDHELSSVNRNNVLSSSYTFRKALIRKHFLSRIIQNYLAKRPHSILRDAVPKTHEIEISFADELDEMWTDELWELGQELEKEEKWWILKPLVFNSAFQPSGWLMNPPQWHGRSRNGNPSFSHKTADPRNIRIF